MKLNLIVRFILHFDKYNATLNWTVY